MYKVRTSLDDKEKAKLLANALVSTHAAVSVHIKKVDSTYAWDGRIDNMTEYEVEAFCSVPNNAKLIIDDYHHYALPEFIYVEMKCSKEIEDWCNNWCKQFKKPKIIS